MAKGYTTEVQIEDYLLIDINPSFSTRITQWITAMETYIERYTGKIFKADTVATEKVFTVEESGILYIPDAVEITQITVDDDIITETDDVDIGYYVGQRQGEPIKFIRYPGFYVGGYKNVKVTAKWGSYITPPDDIVFAATVLVAGIVNNGANSGGEVQSETIGRYTVSYKTTSQKLDFTTVKEILKSYKSYKYI